MIVHRLLDAFFRTLDAVDAVRDRVDQILGKEPRPDPWAVDWPPPETSHGAAGAGEEAAREGPSSEDVSAAPSEEATSKKKTTAKKEPAKSATKAASATKKAASKKASATKKAATEGGKKAADAAKKKAGRKKANDSNRKGSVDRSGKDLESARADAIKAKIASEGWALIDENADYAGKKVLGRTMWALLMAEQAGETDGLTTNDVSALLSKAADIEVFATNIGRACRDHEDLIEVGAADGRSKLYRLTAAGKAAASAIATRP